MSKGLRRKAISLVLASCVLAAVVSLSGCTTREVEVRGPFTALEGLERARAVGSAWNPNAVLVYIGGVEAWPAHPIGDVPSGVLDSWAYGFYDPLDGGTREVVVRGDGRIEQSGDDSPSSFKSSFLPLRARLSVDSTAALRSAAQALDQPTGSDADVGVVDYWLSASGSGARWTVLFRSPQNGARAAWVDAATGFASEAPIGLTLNFTTARSAAEPAARVWNADAVLVEAVAPERPGGYYYLGFVHNAEDSAVIPPDTVPADGRAPLWGLRYYSPGTGEARTFLVEGSRGVTAGDAFKVPVPADLPIYEPPGLPQALMDPSDSIIQGSRQATSFVTYALRDVPSHVAVWSLEVRSGDAIVGELFNATTGESIA